MQTAKEVLNELKWRDDRYLDEAEIYYVHRGAPGDYKIIRGFEIIDLGRSFITLEHGKIPYHRVFKIIYEGKAILSRKRS